MNVLAIGRKEFLDAMKAAGIPSAQNAEEKALYLVDAAAFAAWKERLRGKLWSVIEWRE